MEKKNNRTMNHINSRVTILSSYSFESKLIMAITDRNKISKGISWWVNKEKSKEGNALYQEKLGFELYRGKIIEKDVDEAIKLLEKAKSNGSPNAKKYLELIRLK